MPAVLQDGERIEDVRVQPLLGNERDVTKIDRLVSGAYPAIISVANLHSIRLDTSQIVQTERMEGGRMRDCLPRRRQSSGLWTGDRLGFLARYSTVRLADGGSVRESCSVCSKRAGVQLACVPIFACRGSHKE